MHVANVFEQHAGSRRLSGLPGERPGMLVQQQGLWIRHPRLHGGGLPQ